MPLLIAEALHEVPLVMILYFMVVVPESLSVAETVRLSLVPPTVVVMVGAVVSFVTKQRLRWSGSYQRCLVQGHRE